MRFLFSITFIFATSLLSAQFTIEPVHSCASESVDNRIYSQSVSLANKQNVSLVISNTPYGACGYDLIIWESDISKYTLKNNFLPAKFQYKTMVALGNYFYIYGLEEGAKGIRYVIYKFNTFGKKVHEIQLQKEALNLDIQNGLLCISGPLDESGKITENYKIPASREPVDYSLFLDENLQGKYHFTFNNYHYVNKRFTFTDSLKRTWTIQNSVVLDGADHQEILIQWYNSQRELNLNLILKTQSELGYISCKQAVTDEKGNIYMIATANDKVIIENKEWGISGESLPIYTSYGFLCSFTPEGKFRFFITENDTLPLGDTYFNGDFSRLQTGGLTPMQLTMHTNGEITTCYKTQFGAPDGYYEGFYESVYTAEKAGFQIFVPAVDYNTQTPFNRSINIIPFRLKP